MILDFHRCPNCNRKPELIRRVFNKTAKYCAVCECGNKAGFYTTKDQAIYVWNKRVDSGRKRFMIA